MPPQDKDFVCDDFHNLVLQSSTPCGAVPSFGSRACLRVISGLIDGGGSRASRPAKPAGIALSHSAGHNFLIQRVVWGRVRMWQRKFQEARRRRRFFVACLASPPQSH
eukprot:5121007-Pyramimonas_sp.AAC.1